MIDPELERQLRLLIERYGAPEVRKQLTRLTRAPKRKTRKTAVQFVGAMSLPATHKDKLLNLAHVFDDGSFLPNAGAIRDLFQALGAEPGEIKARQAAMPTAFKLLASCPTERLDRIISRGLFCGPVELAPIAEAIRASSEKLRYTGKVHSLSGDDDRETGSPGVMPARKVKARR